MDSVAAILLCALCAAPDPRDAVDVAPVWSGHPVGFALLTHGPRQFVAYYDAERRMTVAARTLGETGWKKAVLPETLGWDSHNYVTLAVDDDGFLHLSGNMHARPLVYFRTREPLIIDTFERTPMVGEREEHVTYPEFLRGPKDELIFTYRDGRSGSGDEIYNVYTTASKTWRRLLDTPLMSGEGRRNAYPEGPVKGPDGLFHMCWVWRDDPDCVTNHDPGYARSADLVHWETGAGKPLTLPITLENADVVDPVPVRGGILNGNVKLGFDSTKRPVVTYHKYDKAGKTQVYNARIEDGVWKVYRISDWDYRWDFGGPGAIVVEIRLSGVGPAGDGQLKQTYRHIKYGSGTWIVDETTMTRLEDRKSPSEPASAAQTSGMVTHRAADLGGCDEPGVRYVLEWETLDANRDRPREGEPPLPSMLRVVKTHQ